MATVGPVSMIVGQTSKATVVGYDQNGNPMPATFQMPTPAWSIDNATLDSSTPQPDGSDTVVSLAAGLAHLTATVTSAAGSVLTDTEQITNTAPAPVLSSVKVAFTPPS